VLVIPGPALVVGLVQVFVIRLIGDTTRPAGSHESLAAEARSPAFLIKNLTKL
jgi:hypothetical protein